MDNLSDLLIDIKLSSWHYKHWPFLIIAAVMANNESVTFTHSLWQLMPSPQMAINVLSVVFYFPSMRKDNS